MAVKTEIMTQKVANSSYDATEKAGKLGKLVKQDLKGTEWKVEILATEGATSGTEVTTIALADDTSGSIIKMTYTNSSLREGMLEENKPAQSGSIEFEIGLEEQDATLKIDGVVVAGGNQDPVDPTPIVDPTAGFGAVNDTYKGSFGNLVSGYNPSLGEGWKLFYADSTSAYLISAAVTYESLNSLSGWNSNTLTESNVSALGKNLNGKFTSWDAQANNYNLKGVAALLDTSKWLDYKTDDATWAIGSPTIEMFIASYNATHTSKQLHCTVENESATGYKIAMERYSTVGQYGSNLTNMKDSNEKLNALFWPYFYLIASPSAAGSVYVMNTEITGNRTLAGWYDCNEGAPFRYRPVVSVPLSKIGNEIKITNNY